MTVGSRGLRASRATYVLRIAAVALAYFFMGRLGLSVPFTSGNVSPVWPPAGIALGSLLLWGDTVWPGIMLGAFFANLLSPIPHSAALGIAVGSTLGNLTGASLLRRIPGFQPTLVRLQDVLGLFTIGALGGTAISASLGVAALTLAHVRAWSGFGTAWMIWWLGDAMGVLVFAPLVLTFTHFVRDEDRQRLPEFVLLCLATIVCCFVLFDRRVGLGVAEDTLAFAVFPFVIWAATRFGVGGAAISALLITAVTLWETASGSGPFVREKSPLHNAAIWQCFLAVISTSGMALAAAIAERQRAERALQRQTEEALATASHGLRLAQQTANIGSWEWNIPAGRISWSPELEQIHGFHAGTFDGRYETFISTVHFDDRDGLEKAVSRALTDGTPYDVEYRSIRPDGNLYWTSARGKVFFDAEDKPYKMAGICMDITARKQAEEALRRSEKLAAAGRLAATMAHEINNPLEAVTNLLYLASADTSLSQHGRRYLQMADEELRRISHLSKQTLGFYRDTSSPSMINAAETLDEVLLIYEKKLEAKKIKVRREYDAEANLTAVAGDLRQVFSNLVANAIDASYESGTLVVRVARSRDWKDSGHFGLRISIADNGCGIALDQRSRVFEPFYTTKQDVGTGLGLWVTSDIVHKHGGSIRFRSRCGPSGNGTVFSVFLPEASRAGSAAA